MVYEIKCVECGEMLDFGGEPTDELPEEAIEFNGDIYCRNCVRKFVEFGTGSLEQRFEALEEAVEDIRQHLGMEKGLNI
ncbi:hypothetical protein [Candidatus Nanohalococcus occultus]|uniref:Zinc ribbon domain-containing protein n=1 Tax=Candidatus Nanohalococcus occultus TaxID=2978047 RepID=A0ABY8CE09_9ARCH|nr:hypothetical protein SVXNc_0430 [Candidatus Nanohaloarchaeota archaeon SVXNc]